MKQRKHKRLALIEEYLGEPAYCGTRQVQLYINGGRKATLDFLEYQLSPIEYLVLMEAVIEQTVAHSFFVDQLFARVNHKEATRQPIATRSHAIYSRCVANARGVGASWNWQRPRDIVVPRSETYLRLMKAIRNDYGDFIQGLVALESGAALAPDLDK